MRLFDRLDKFTALFPLLMEVLDPVGFERLSHALDNLDFRVCTELLRGVASVGKTLGGVSVG